MSNFHRIVWIDAELRAGRRPNASTIAARFEISRRQAARDIEYMRYSMGAPIAYVPEGNGYTYTDDGFALPALFLSEEERSALRSAGAPDSERDPERAEVVRRFLARIEGMGTLAQIREAVPAGLRSDARETRARLRRAIDQQLVVVLEGSNPGEVISISRVHPYRLAFARERVDVAYLIGYCESRKAVHAFHLGFVREVRVTSDHFRELRPHPDALIRVRTPYVARLEMAPPLPPALAAGARWLDGSRCEVEFSSSGALLGALLEQPTPFRILAPGWLVRRLRRRLADLLERNAG